MEKSTAFSSEGGFTPLPNLPPGTGCAGEAGARSGTPTGCGISRGRVAFTPHATRVTGTWRSPRPLARRGASPPFRTSPQEPVAPAKPALEAERPPGAVFLVAVWRLLPTRRASREHGEVHGL